MNVIYKKKFALVTGVSGGIGSSIVEKLCNEGVNVLGVDLVESDYKNLLFKFYKMDLNEFITDTNISNSFFQFIEKWLDGNSLDLLINNAAIQCLGDIKTLDLEIWNKTLNVNLLAPFFLIQGFLDHLINGKGCVINISSIHARATKANFISYATSKAAISGMNRALSVELGSSLSFYCIEPAAVLTNMLKEGFIKYPDKLKELAKCHPSGEISSPDQLADFVYFLFERRIPALQGTAIEFGGGISGRLFDPA
jgi:NAD(P)-dependent dehydrogenase (short-subunit alcohol dehydrogenase family)